MQTITVIRYDRYRLPRTGAVLDVVSRCDPFTVAMARLPATFGAWPDRAPINAQAAQKAFQGPAIAPRSPQPNERRASASEPGRREPTEE